MNRVGVSYTAATKQILTQSRNLNVGVSFLKI
jgi:hypothetical protein